MPVAERSKAAAARLLRLQVRITPEAWMCTFCCVLTSGVLCYKLITHPEESYRLCCVVACDIRTSKSGGPGPRWAVAPQEK